MGGMEIVEHGDGTCSFQRDTRSAPNDFKRSVRTDVSSSAMDRSCLGERGYDFEEWHGLLYVAWVLGVSRAAASALIAALDKDDSLTEAELRVRASAEPADFYVPPVPLTSTVTVNGPNVVPASDPCRGLLTA